jgi:mannosyltransferase
MAHVLTTLRWLHHYRALLIVLLLAAGLRGWSARESLWVDELHTSWVVADGQAAVTPRAMLGNHSPLYFQLVWCATRIVGGSEWGLRGLSLMAGLALIVAVYAAVQRWTGNRLAAWLAAAVTTLDTNQLFFSVEARPYAVLQLAALLHIALLAERVTRPSSKGLRVAFIGLGAMLVYLHYTAGLMLVAEAVAALFLLARRATRGVAMALLLDLFLALVLCLGALPHALQIAEHRAQWSAFVRPAPWPAIFTQLRGIWYLAAPLLACLSVLRHLVRRGAVRRGTHEPTCTASGACGRRCLIVGCWWLVPILVTWTLTRYDIAPLFLNRYLMICAAAPPVLAALLVSRLTPRLQWISGTALLLVTLYVNHYERLRQPQAMLFARGEDWRGLVETLQQTADDRQRRFPLLVHSGLIEADHLRPGHDNPKLLRDYCRLPVLGRYDLSSWASTIYPLRNKRPYLVDPPAEAAARSAGGAWLIIRGRSDAVATAIQDELRAGWPDSVIRLRRTLAFGRVRLLELQVTGR